MAAFNSLIETLLGLKVELAVGLTLKELSHFFEPLIAYSVSRILFGD